MTEMPSGGPSPRPRLDAAAEKIDTAWRAPRAASRAGARLEQHLSRHELPPIGALDDSLSRHSPRARHGPDAACAGRVARLAPVRAECCRRAGALPDDHHADAVVRGLHLRFAARRDPGRRRPADAAHHRDHASPRQRRPRQRRTVRVHARLRGHGAQPPRPDRSTTSCRSSRPCWPLPAWRCSCSSSTTPHACCGRSAFSRASATKA